MITQNDEKQNFFKFIFKTLKKHWIWNTIILFIPAIWFPLIINQFGNILHLTYIKNNKTTLTNFALILSVFLYLLVFCILTINSRQANKEELSNQKELDSVKSSCEQLNYIISCINDICNNKLDMLIDSFRTKEIHTDPSKQIEIILQKIASCLADVSKIDLRKINVTLAYKYMDNHEDWCWSEYSKIDGGLSLLELINNSNTTFYLVASGKREFVFFNDKTIAEENEHYVLDTRDKSHGKTGSIICESINVGTPERQYIKAILSITTYGKKFVPDDNKKIIDIVESNIRDVILPEFKLRIQIELAHLYLKYLQLEKANTLCIK